MKRLAWAAFAMTYAFSVVAHAEQRAIESVAASNEKFVLAEWTPAQQYIMPPWGRKTGMPREAPVEFRDRFGMLVFADELGDKLSELGRFSLVSMCIRSSDDKSHILRWALCGPDAKALDLKKLEAELKADNITPDSQKAVLAYVQEELARVKKIGDEVEAAAKEDPGIAQVLGLPEAAKAEWNAYLAKNKPAFERYLLLKDAVRSRKSNHKNFEGCFEATLPAFKKLVASSKFEWEVDRYLSEYMFELQSKGTEAYITAASFGACALSIDKTGEILAAAALSGDAAGHVRVGWRTIAAAMAIDEKLKPKFADRNLNWSKHGMLYEWVGKEYFTTGAGNGPITASLTPHQGEIKKITKDGDRLKLSFKGDTRDACLEWKETNKVQTVGANGDVMYQKVCKKRGAVENQEEDVEVHAKFADGLKPGVSVHVIQGFPVTAWKGKKFVSVFGMPAAPNGRK